MGLAQPGLNAQMISELRGVGHFWILLMDLQTSYVPQRSLNCTLSSVIGKVSPNLCSYGKVARGATLWYPQILS